MNIKKLLSSLLLVSLIFFLSACSNHSAASDLLKGTMLNKVSGNGPDKVTFVNNDMYAENDYIPPVVKNPEEMTEPKIDGTYKNIKFKDEDERYLVIYDNEVLFSFELIDDDLLEDLDSNQYRITPLSKDQSEKE
ncbi:hypothetical protein [Allofustis seminis]|uniref:hypothetical protein n=1 Tax=Allofustis seminis TaxID=166939 RepID=UPI00037985DF|nr:hypothetical protein [Allofustis seminis]